MFAERETTMKSIIQDKEECYVTHATENIQLHHIFFGHGNRKISDDNGFTVWLRWDQHIAASPFKTPHNDRDTDLYYKKLCQEKYEETHTREEFIELIGKSYL